ncbi:MAG: hypothetical protein WDN10_01165 [bacterium]
MKRLAQAGVVAGLFFLLAPSAQGQMVGAKLVDYPLLHQKGLDIHGRMVCGNASEDGTEAFNAAVDVAADPKRAGHERVKSGMCSTFDGHLPLVFTGLGATVSGPNGTSIIAGVYVSDGAAFVIVPMSPNNS